MLCVLLATRVLQLVKKLYICLLKHDKQFMEETKEQGIGGDREVE